MRELGIKAQYVKPYTVTTIDSDFSEELENILNEQFNPTEPDTIWCSDITYMDLCRICIFDKRYGLIFKKNNCLGSQ